MFWRFGFHSPSAIDAKLDKPDVTVEEILQDDDLLQECKGHNRKLIDFLSRPSTLEAVFSYAFAGAAVGQETDPNLEDRSNLSTRKLSYLSCEVIGCEISFVLDELATPAVLDNLFSYADKPLRHNFLLSNHFSRAVNVLLTRKPLELVEYLESKPELLTKLLGLLHIFQVSELLPSMAISPSDGRMVALFEKASLLKGVLDAISQSTDEEVINNAANSVIDITSLVLGGKASGAVLQPILNADILGKFIDDSFLLEQRIRLRHGLRIITKLLEHAKDHSSKTTDSSLVDAIVAALKPRFTKLATIIKEFQAPKVSLSSGILSPPVGLERILAAELVSLLAGLDNQGVDSELGESGVLQALLDIFFNYPCNNLFHGKVQEIVTFAIERETSSLNEHIFGKGNLLGRIRASYGSDDSDPKRSLFNYCHRGFLTKMSNTVQSMACKFLNYSNEDWDKFVNGPLVQENEREKAPVYDEPETNNHTSSLENNAPTGFLDDDDDDGDATPASLHVEGDQLSGNQLAEHFDANFDAAFDANFDDNFGNFDKAADFNPRQEGSATSPFEFGSQNRVVDSFQTFSVEAATDGVQSISFEVNFDDAFGTESNSAVTAPSEPETDVSPEVAAEASLNPTDDATTTPAQSE
eukprot:TRINITY_DN626_c0_g1_i1.p1 TRINITY_DN626_c0_g1~~TRINITY_DN626_c0_g1_i1.p1  ORF type:complete len:640 (+),score=147.50 TRINITY_DN626_c0_g1_i1:45-1964(+)